MRTHGYRAWFSAAFASEMLEESYPGEVFRWKHEGQDIKIMEYIGKTDKNGVEICEGDIYFDEGVTIVGYSTPIEYKNYRIVQFDEKKLMFNAKIHCGTCTIDPKCEIVGNIYENPELMYGGK